MMNKYFLAAIFSSTLLIGCDDDSMNTAIAQDALKPTVVTDQTKHDTDDPAIWINAADSSQSLIIGTDKDSDGALYVFDLNGKTVKTISGLKRPNNVDVAYGLQLGGKRVDIAVTTERETNKIRVYQLPEMTELGNGFDVFVNEKERAPMGLALYTNPADSSVYAVVGRKSGPVDNYLWQYKLSDDGNGNLKAEVVRKFGKYSGTKEIEAIAVDNELGYIYYSDEQVGLRKYYADPAKGNEELAFFGQNDFASDNEGISIYKSSDSTGYVLVSNQQDNSFNVYPREGNDHRLITKIPASTIESDGSDVVNVNLGSTFPQGVFVAMSNGKVFHYYDWREMQAKIDAASANK